MGYTGDNQKPNSAEKKNQWRSFEILEKAFHALRAGFLRQHKKYPKEGKLANKGWKFLKNEPKTSEKFYIYIWSHR